MFITNRSRPWNHVLYSENDDLGSGEQPPAPDTAAADTAPEGATQQEVDWAKRYSDLQPEYTRTTQELSQLRQREDAYKALLYSDDQDTRQQAAQALGIELADDVDDTQYDDPTEKLASRLERLEQQYTGDVTARQQQEQIAALETAAETSMDTLKVPKDEGLRNWLVSRAVALPATEHGTLNMEAAWAEFGQLMDAQKKTWADTKRTHAFAPGGGEGTQALPLDAPHSDRVQSMLAKLQRDQG